MLLHYTLVLVEAVLAQIADALSYIQGGFADLPAMTLTWPVEWLPYEPVLIAISVGTFTVLFMVGIKVARWVYGMVPIVQ